MINPPDSTVYTFWDGTNDLGFYAFIEDAQVKGTNLVTYTDCIYNQIQRVYDNGGRYFVLMNIAPLNLAPEVRLFNAANRLLDSRLTFKLAVRRASARCRLESVLAKQAKE